MASASFPRRDHLIDIATRVQAQWKTERAFDVDAPEPDTQQAKYFATFPYPYMNGLLHLGHAFTISKVDFAVRFQSLLGKRVLFPFGFHCTGMPIVACANRLSKEIEMYGLPPVFPNTETKEQDKEKKKKPGKVVAKNDKNKWQWKIMEEMGVEATDIPKFRDPRFWLTYFPPLALQHLQAFGVHTDFRRSFLTTDLNPYYDSFVRWQFNTLKEQGKIVGHVTPSFPPKTISHAPTMIEPSAKACVPKNTP